MAYKLETKKASASAALTDAFSEITSLQEEMDEWASNLEDSNLANTQKCSDVRDAADTLTGVDELEVPKSFSDVEITYAESVNRNKRRGPSRSVRRDNAATILDVVAQTAREQAEKAATDEAREELEGFADELENHKDTIEGVEFPGMF